jgi:DNA repair photolyase
VVAQDRGCPRGRFFDRVAVRGEHERWGELDRALERPEVRAKRVRPRVRIEADGRSDVRQEVVAGREDAAPQEAEVTVRVARQLDDLPSVDDVTVLERLGIARELDERRDGPALLDHLVGDQGRSAMDAKPARDPFGPAFVPPYAPALLVVEPALVDGRAGGRSSDASAPHVIGVEVRDHDPVDSLLQLGLEQVGEARQAEARVDEQAAVLTAQHVAVDMARRQRQRERDPADAARELLDAAILSDERVFYNRGVRAQYREEPCKVALNRVRGMPFNWSLNPYMGCVHRCTFCYVRAFELRADRPPDDRYGRSIRVKVNVAEVLRRELARPSWRHESVAVGAATDPYQPAEGRYRLTRACLEAFADAHNPFNVITRGPLIVRDVDVLQEAAQRAEVAVNFSVPTLDQRVWRTTEPGTAPPKQRLRALRTLVDAGIKAGVGMAPILPGISDRPDQLREVVLAARAAGATHLWANVLFLRPGTREHFLEHLAEDWPEEAERYAQLYASRAYLGKDVTGPLQARVADLRCELGIADRRDERLAPPPEPQQLSLAV